MGGPFRSDIKTVYVEIFESKTFRRNIEFDLTEALKKRIGTGTPYRVAPKEKADTILRGEIVEALQTAWAPDFRTRVPRDRQITLVCRIEWKDTRTGALLVEDEFRVQAVDYLPPAGETEVYALQKAAVRLADRIVDRMYEDF